MSATTDASSESCPSEVEILALLAGELTPEALARSLAHAERCHACALVVAEAGLAFAQRAPQDALPRSAQAVFAPGQVVASRYRIERRIGRGGMGEVYSALDQEFGERVALKTICPGIASDPRSVDRFKLELRLARSISHPSVCKVLEFGRHELTPGASQCFFTLDFIEGVTLRQRLHEGTQVELGTALTWLEALARGLDAIHEQNVVHRDIKPENVMLPANHGDAVAIWVDFGLARVDLRESHSAGVLAGTPDYSAPELVRGAVASRASDLYAFGVVMHELLTGELPFARSTSFWTASRRHAVRLQAPSARRPEISPELDALVLACLEEFPEKRPSSAAHVAERLHAVAVNLYLEPYSRASQLVLAPVAASAPAPAEITARTRRSNRWRLIVSLAITAAGTGLAIYHTPFEDDAPSSASRGLEVELAPSAPRTPSTASSDTTPAEPTASPTRKAAPKRLTPATAPTPATTPPASASAAPAPAATRTLPNFGGRR